MSPLSIGFHGEALDRADVQILSYRPHVMRIHLLYVRLACSREGGSIGPCAVKVPNNFSPQLWAIDVWTACWQRKIMHTLGRT